ncbi:MAG: hypothetical protein OHK0046_23010 [Anaerolineae bacterium]
MNRKVLIPILILVFAFGVLVRAQDITPRPDAELNESANISWPPPVYVLRGEVDLRGTADLPNMTNYFIEFRPLEFPEEGEEPDNNRPWFPVTLPDDAPVIEGVLGTWNTETAPDGLYELRLTVNASGQPATFFIVSPIRIENDIPEFLVDSDLVATPQPAQPAATATPGRFVRPTLAPSPTALDTTPRVTAVTDANVRAGDNVSYERIGSLNTGDTVRVLGISSGGSGWYFIELEDGTRGWIAPSVVNPAGDLRSVPRISPPATPTPTFTPTPVTTGNLTGNPPSLSPAQPVCGQEFRVLVNVFNAGSQRTSGDFIVTIQDVHVASGQVQSTFSEVVPALDPGQNYVVGNDLRFNITTFTEEEHRIVATIDVNNSIRETNEQDNSVSTTYVLQRGACP